MNQISPELIKKYLRGECSMEEELLVHFWYDAFDDMPDPYSALSEDQKQQLKERMLGRIIPQLSPAPVIPGSRKITYLIYGLITAAIITVILGIPAIFKGSVSTAIQTSDNDELIEVTNDTKTIEKRLLPDSSIVWLNPGARIRYHKNFRKRIREIRLTGESFFEVTKDHAHPFVIYSPHITTRVWGTSFRVHDLPGKKVAEVVVVTGKVSVMKAAYADLKDHGVLLLPRQRVLYDQFVDRLKVTAVEKRSSISIWNKTNLNFDNITLAEAIKMLNKQFEVQILLEDEKLSNSKIQADFSNQSFPDILEILTKLLKATYVTDGKIFKLQAVPAESIINKPKNHGL